MTLTARQHVVVGREGDVPLGVNPEDHGVSRRAIHICVDVDGWRIRSTNANGAALYPWGQPGRWLEYQTPTQIRWPLVGLRVMGADPNDPHWVLLEDEALTPTQTGSAKDWTNTVVSRPPAPLTEPQQVAAHTVFSQHLAWPPVAGPVALTLQAAAARLGISHAAVYQRLEAIRARAYLLGSPQQTGVTDPEYLYVLVRAGLIIAPPQRGLDTS